MSIPQRDFGETAGFSSGRSARLCAMELIPTLLDYVGDVVLIAVSLGGFAACVAGAVVFLAGERN